MVAKPRHWIRLILEEQPGGDWAADIYVDGELKESYGNMQRPQVLPTLAKRLVEYILGARSDRSWC